MGLPLGGVKLSRPSAPHPSAEAVHEHIEQHVDLHLPFWGVGLVAKRNQHLQHVLRSNTCPELPVSFSTEGLGGSLRRLRDDSAALAICLLPPDVPEDIAAYPLLRIGMRPVVAPCHPLASLKRQATRDDLEPHVQLVLSDPVDPCAAAYGLASVRLWRFVDLGRRLDFLLAGFGWCRMPEHLVAAPLAEAKLVALRIEADPTPEEGLVIYAAHRRDRALGGVDELVDAGSSG